MTAALPPLFDEQFFDAGSALAGGKIATYISGTTTDKDTYTDASGSTANTNPIILDSEGRCSMWLKSDGSAYTLRLMRADNSLVRTFNDVVGIESVSAAASIRADLLNTSDTAKGDALIGVKRTDIAGALALTLHQWIQGAELNVMQLGVVGDGVTDDTAALIALGALGKDLFIPATANCKISSTVTFSCNIRCQGVLTPTVAVGANPVVQIPSAGYSVSRRIDGLQIQGNTTLRAAGVYGIRSDCEHAFFTSCRVHQLAFGIVIRTYSNTVFKCMFQQCNTNISAYKTVAGPEINTLTILSGTADSAVNCAINLADTSWSDAFGNIGNDAGNIGGLHGVDSLIGGNVSIDGAPIKVGGFFNTNLDDIHIESSASGYAILAGVLDASNNPIDGATKGLRLANSFIKGLKVAVKCIGAVEGVLIEESNEYIAVTQNALYLASDIYSFTYRKGRQTGSFSEGPEVHTGFRFIEPPDVNFTNATIDFQGLSRGVQKINQDVNEWYPGAEMCTGLMKKTDSSGSPFRRYTSPQSGISGTVLAGNAFRFTTASQAKPFNGGDGAVVSTGGVLFIRFVEYDNGSGVATAYLDGSPTLGAATLSQVQSSARTEVLVAAMPTTGTWSLGDRAINITPSAGSPKAWSRITSGSGNILNTDWRSEGNL